MPKKKQETVMVICAHPDDEILGAGGTIAKYTQAGKRVISVVFSYGETSHWWLKKKHTVEMRVKECRAAGAVVGTEQTFFLGLKDFDLKNEIKDKVKLKPLEKLIAKFSPDRIFTHSPEDIIYQDHKAVWDAVEFVTGQMKYKGDIFVFNIWAKNIRLSKNPRLLVDISDTFRLKIDALKCFRSQMMYIWQLMPGVFTRALKAGWDNKTRYAEAFIKVK
jgi:LmbE family N-acetylglucosaminyl deacetylase